MASVGAWASRLRCPERLPCPLHPEKALRMKSMDSPMSLKTRITLSFVLLISAVMGVVVIAEQVDFDEVRQYVAAQNLRSQVPALQAALSQSRVPTVPEGSHLYAPETVPEALRAYAPGYHRLALPQAQHLLVFDHQDARYYLTEDAQGYAYLELLIDGFGPLVILLCVLGAFWIGRRTSTRITAPIKQLAHAIEHHQKPLPFQDAQDEIGVLARAFAQHSEELEQFLQRERFFVGDASHELRTPLAIISGAAETIAHQLPADSRLLPSATRIVRATEEMQRQLSCLLLLSREAHTLAFSPTAVRPLVQDCMDRCAPLLARKPVALVLDAPHDIELNTHAELARSVVWNILRNACQYTAEGEVRIHLHANSLTITDTGPGLPSSIDPQQFQRFAHRTGGAAAHSGEGLGLSLVQRIVERLGWRMEVRSSAQGCRFTLHFPPRP